MRIMHNFTFEKTKTKLAKTFNKLFPGLAIIAILCFPACSPESRKAESSAAHEGEEIPLEKGKVRMSIRFAADESIFTEALYPMELSSKPLL